MQFETSTFVTSIWSATTQYTSIQDKFPNAIQRLFVHDGKDISIVWDFVDMSHQNIYITELGFLYSQCIRTPCSKPQILVHLLRTVSVSYSTFRKRSVDQMKRALYFADPTPQSSRKPKTTSQTTPSAYTAQSTLESASVFRSHTAFTFVSRCFSFGEPFLHLCYSADVLDNWVSQMFKEMERSYSFKGFERVGLPRKIPDPNRSKHLNYSLRPIQASTNEHSSQSFKQFERFGFRPKNWIGLRYSLKDALTSTEERRPLLPLPAYAATLQPQLLGYSSSSPSSWGRYSPPLILVVLRQA